MGWEEVTRIRRGVGSARLWIDPAARQIRAGLVLHDLYGLDGSDEARHGGRPGPWTGNGDEGYRDSRANSRPGKLYRDKVDFSA